MTDRYVMLECERIFGEQTQSRVTVSSVGSAGKQFRHRLPLPRQNQFRRDFAQRLKHKPPQMRARMRQNQFRRVARFISERDQIQIQRARLVQNFFWLAAKFLFQFAQFFQQRFRRFLCPRNQTGDGIHKLRRIRRTIHRRRLPERRFAEPARRKIFATAPARQNDLPRIAEIRAERDESQFNFELSSEFMNLVAILNSIELKSFQPQHVLHVVKAGLLLHDPLRGAQRAVGKRVAARRLVRQLHALAGVRKNDRVVAHDIAAADRMDADLRRRAFADDALATVPRRLRPVAACARPPEFPPAILAVPLGASFFRRWCISTTSRSKSGPRISAALRVSQNSVLTPVEKFDAQTMGICALASGDLERVGVRVAGGADDQRLFVFRAQLGDFHRGACAS